MNEANNGEGHGLGVDPRELSPDHLLEWYKDNICQGSSIVELEGELLRRLRDPRLFELTKSS